MAMGKCNTCCYAVKNNEDGKHYCWWKPPGYVGHIIHQPRITENKPTWVETFFNYVSVNVEIGGCGQWEQKEA